MKGPVVQVFAATLATLAMMSGGMFLGWSSPSLPLLLADDSDLPLTSDQSSWVVSFFMFGSIFGPVLAALLVDRIGRKCALYTAVLPMLVAWVITAFASNYKWLYAARFMGGLGNGAIWTISPMYLGEIADDKIRGVLGTLSISMYNLGMLIAFSTGPWVSRQMLALISSIPPLIFMITFFWIPESPYYLLAKGDREAADSSLMWYRRRKDVQKELETMEHNIKLQQQNKTSVFELVRNPGNRKALLIIGGIISTTQFCGNVAVQSYASTIFEKSGFSLSSSVSVIIMGVVKFLAVFAAVLLVDVAGRRPLLIISALGVALSNLTIAIYYHLQALEYDLSHVTWLPLCSVLFSYATYGIGIGCLGRTMIGEMFPMNVKASAIMVQTMYGSTVGMIVSKLYQVVADALGVQVVFYAFATFTAFGLVFITFCVPETKGRTLQDIQDELNSRTSTKDYIKRSDSLLTASN